MSVSTPPSASSTSRTPSPFELGEARRVNLRDPHGAIQMVALSAGVEDAFCQARQELAGASRTPSPSASLRAPSSRSAHSARSISPPRSISRQDSHAPMIPPPADVVPPDELSPLTRSCALAASVAVMLTATAIVASLVYWVYMRTLKSQ
jgi:hypothetical protein